MLKSLLLMLFVFTTLSFAEEQSVVSKIYLRINGHEYALPDEVARELSNYYLNTKDDMAAEQINKKVGGYYIKEMKLGDNISKFIYEKLDDQTIQITLRIGGNNAKLEKYFLFFRIINTITFTLDINVKLNMDIKNASFVFIIDNAQYIMRHIHVKGSFNDALAHIFNGFKSINYSGSLNDFEGDTIPVFKFYDNEATTVVAGADEDDEINALNNSLPLEITPIYQNTPESKLILDIKFLYGYYQDDGTFDDSFSNYTPTITNSNSITYAGVSYLHWSAYDDIDKNNPSLSDKEDRFDVLISKLEDLDLNHLRIEAMWNKIVPPINSISSSLHPSQIPDEAVEGDIIDDYIAEIDANGGWDTLDYFINTALASPAITSPYVVVGCGHSSRMPYYDDNGNLKRIAPGTVRPDTLSGYIGVTQDVYLYWLKKYARAVVRRYKNKIDYWQIENELNAARFTESFGWWRVGDAWGEDFVGGFQDKVIQILSQAVRVEDPDINTKRICAFHLFNAAKRIKEWNQYFDIVGLNIYPHLFHAYPVLGFFPGEFVWSAKRILTAIGTPEKNVWITETGYPAKTSGPPPVDFDSSLTHFSQQRQKQYLEEAMSSCMQNGATGFDWYQLYTSETDNASNDFEINNNYNGLYDENNNQKLAAPAYKDLFQANNNLETVTFTTKTLDDENLDGTFNIEAAVVSLPSGNPVKLVPNRDYDVYANEQRLTRSDNSVVQHYRWNDEDYFKLNRTYNSFNDINNQIAR